MKALALHPVSPVVLCIGAGLVAMQLLVAVHPGAPAAGVIGVGLRVMLAAWGLAVSWVVALAMIRGRDVDRSAWPLRVLGRASLLAVVAAGGVLIAFSFQRVPTRLVANVLGYAAVQGAVVWLVRHRAGENAAAAAASLVAVFCLAPGVVNRASQPSLAMTDPQSGQMWPVGWPNGGWVLRHEVEVPPHLADRPLLVRIPTAEGYRGMARVQVAVNRRPAGVAELQRDALSVRLPPSGAERRLVIELTLDVPDPALRLIAHRWVPGSSAGPSPSSYFDGERWWKGTFNEQGGRRQDGAYLMLVTDWT